MIQSTTSGKKSTSEDQSLLQTTKGNYGYELPLEIKVEGAFTNYVGFVKKIESYQRLMNIVNMEITKPVGSAGDAIEAKLKVTAYLKK
jgi:Tfp pilus assembly protein PilO